MNIDIIGNINDSFDMLAEHGFKLFVNIFTILPSNGIHFCLDHIFIKTKIEAGLFKLISQAIFLFLL